MRCFLLGASVVAFVALASDGFAATYTVDNTSNSAVQNACTAAANDCSLRGAIQRANADAEADVINFSIPSSLCSNNLCTIDWSSGAGAILDHPLEIDASTQPGYQANTIDAVNGAINAVWPIQWRLGSGLLANSDLTLRGIKFLSGNLSTSLSANTVTVEGCHFGPDIVLPNTSYVQPQLAARSLQIGGTQPSQRNVFSQGGFFSGGIGSSFMQGNLFGIKPDGVTPFSNETGSFNLMIMSTTLTGAGTFLVGGVNSSARNYIGGFGGAYSISWNGFSASRPLRVEGNYVGITHANTPVQANNLMVAKWAVFGGLQPGAGNVFANMSSEILLLRSNEATYLSNSAFNNGTGGLFIRDNTFPVNDPNDADFAEQNYPEVLSFARVGNQIQLQYGVDSASSNSVYPLTVQFYKADGLDGAVLLHTDSYSTPQQAKSIQFQLPAGVSFDEQSDVIVAMANPPEVGPPSTFSVYSAQLSFVSPPRLLLNSPATVRVRMVANGPFYPKGKVLIRLSGANTASCVASLSPQATPSVAEGECQVTATQAGATQIRADYGNDPVNRVFVSGVTIDRLQPFFATHITESAPIIQDKLFCHGFEALAPFGACPP
jgi:hypothetical protein